MAEGDSQVSACERLISLFGKRTEPSIMRLINTRTLDLEVFYGSSIPKYAILSHTWEDGEEVTFQEWQCRDTDKAVRRKPGFKKIYGACRLARGVSLDWIWVDTNCIDKSSSAELSEAINSMYAWYRQSQICFAYLSDVPRLETDQQGRRSLKYFRRSRWWTRGWTLQELLAPLKMLFLSQNWDVIEFRQELAQEISAISGIDSIYLLDVALVQTANVAQKMAWLSRRTTTRLEDMAYCMLGLFDVNMPLLYGEGDKAFIRLQEEIIKLYDDHTIFCWTWTNSVPSNWTSMLSPWPDTFANSAKFTTRFRKESKSYSMTNLGLSIHLPVIYTLSYMFVVLNASIDGEVPSMFACIPVTESSSGRGLSRQDFPTSPVILCRGAADKIPSGESEQLHELIIKSRIPFWGTRGMGNLSVRPGFEFGVLLFLNPAEVDVLRPSTHNGVFQLTTSHYNAVDTLPQGAFFNMDSNILYLSNLIYKNQQISCAMICIKSESGSQVFAYYAFFAVTVNNVGRNTWHCGIAASSDVNSKFPFTSSVNSAMNFLELEEPKNIEEQWFKYMIRKVVHGSFTNPLARSPDGTLHLGLGGTLEVQAGLEIRAACISGNGNFVYPIPPIREQDEDDNSDADSIGAVANGEWAKNTRIVI